ncbi:MAG TPA: hypothetical protein VIY48_03870 [Candidatus Paceibacterota bacterium]
MQKISRAGDTLWSVSAFDPRKPVDEDWMNKPPAPILRSGDEPSVFGESPNEHHHITDAMGWSPESVGAEEPDTEDYGDSPGTTFLPGGEVASASRPDVPRHDLEAIGRHARRLRGEGGSTRLGELVGSDPRGPMAQYNNGSNVAHYYTYNPHERDQGKPWIVNTTHWDLSEPLSSRHETFEQAVLGAKKHKAHLKYNLGID